MKRTERYEIVATIQEGMVAVTYKARDRVLDRPVLLKVLRPRLATDSDLVQRFRREALLQARLKHPGIVTVYDFGTEDDFYIASEFVEGRTLEKLLAEKGRLTPAEMTPIVLAVARALEYAHGHGVVHRDLKPANIMISDTGEVKLTDFGLAFARDMDGLTQEGCVIGTPSYMSPEQARGQKVDFRTDIFALGIVVYQALTGTNPFAGATYADALSLILNQEPRPLEELASGLPAGLSELMGRMLAKNPAARPGSTDELMRLLAAPERPVRTATRGRRAALAALLVTVLVAAVVVPIVLTQARHAGGRIQGSQESRNPVTDTGQGGNQGFQDSRGPVAETGQDSRIQGVKESSDVHRTGVQDSRSPASSTRILESSTHGPLSHDSSTPRPLSLTECRLRITVAPWAEVILDGRSLGATPLAAEPVVTPGRHVVTLRNPYYPEVTRTVTLEQPTCTLAFNLDREVAQVYVSVTPWAVVAIDGRVVDTTPMDRSIPVALGSHMITLTHPELGVRRDSIRTDSPRVYRVAYSMKEKGEDPKGK